MTLHHPLSAGGVSNPRIADVRAAEANNVRTTRGSAAGLLYGSVQAA